jgi:GDPmannose 4,6-dehydratase
LDAKRDWGHAKDYIEGMWLMLQHNKPDDFVLATGKTNTVRHFCELAFKEIGVELVWQGDGVQEKGINAKDNTVLIQVDENYYRPTEVDLLIGDPSKANKELGWKHTYTLQSMIAEMIKSDLEIFEKELILKEKGFKVDNYFE